ncbi:hypothetical protein KW805_03020 [Candidatus Pacearchaeota archaeon]|nr:hypothetical protein [Candidatus Pacearchaeota archaeon]
MHRDKKGVSEMVGYVLLILVAVGVSVLVYNFLYVLNPKDKVVCEDDTYLIINSLSCNLVQSNISLGLQNKGLYTVDAAYIRMAPAGTRVRQQINPKLTDFYLWNLPANKHGLRPGESLLKNYTFPTKQGITDYEVEVQPVIFRNNNPILCPSVITQPVHCS